MFFFLSNTSDIQEMVLSAPNHIPMLFIIVTFPQAEIPLALKGK
jgi:hypothetical protein